MNAEERTGTMGMQGGKQMMKYLSIPVLILGLFLTFLLDLALYHEDSRMSRDVLLLRLPTS